MKALLTLTLSLIASIALGQQPKQNPNKMVYPNCSDAVAEIGVKLLQNLVREHSVAAADYFRNSPSKEEETLTFLARKAGATSEIADLLKDLINRQCDHTNKLKQGE